MGRDKLEIWILAYAFYPDKTVGALRTSYWYSELPKVLDCNVTAMTANKSATGSGVIVIPDAGQVSRWNPIRDSGIGWKKDILNHLKTHKVKKPDVVIISGSPFMHFSLASTFKNMFGCKVILDYRDPFANNANFQNSQFKVRIKRYFEKKFNAKADGLITVNPFCGDRIVDFNKKPHVFIQNGYDDRFEPELKPIDLQHPKLVYTGKFYFDPSQMLDAAFSAGTTFVYAGPDKIKDGYEAILDYHGLVDYPSAVQLIGNSDIAVIQTVGDDSISTTKIFDYIRCQRIILVISRDRLGGKGIDDELSAYPNVYWCTNDATEIAKTIEKIRNHSYVTVKPEFIQRFSRRHQMLKLVDFIKLLNP